MIINNHNDGDAHGGVGKWEMKYIKLEEGRVARDKGGEKSESKKIKEKEKVNRIR